MLPSLFYIVDSEDNFLCYIDVYPGDGQKPMTLRNPKADHNEIHYLCHSTDKVHLEEWLSWLKKDKSHADLNPEIIPYLDELHIVEFGHKLIMDGLNKL